VNSNNIDTAADIVVAIAYGLSPIKLGAIAPVVDTTTASFDGRSCPRVEAAINRIIALVGDAQFVRHDRWGPDDGYDGFTPGGQSNRTMTGLEVIEWLNRNIYRIGERQTRCLKGAALCIDLDENYRLKTIYTDYNNRVNSNEIVAVLAQVTCANTFVQMINQCLIDNDECTLYTAAHWAEIERQKMRKECEAAASQLMHRHGLERIDCLETIKAIYADLDASEEAYEAHMDPDARTHRYGMHKGSGSDAYHQDEDHATFQKMNTDDGLHRLLTYMRLYFPLLWSEWNATQQGK